MPTDELDDTAPPADLDATLHLLGEALSTDAPLTAERTLAAVRALTTAAGYLTTATGPAVSASVPTTADLAKVLLGTHITLHQLHTSLYQLHAGIARRSIAAGVSLVDVARMQGALNIAVDRLGTAAMTVGAASEVLAAPAAQS